MKRLVAITLTILLLIQSVVLESYFNVSATEIKDIEINEINFPDIFFREFVIEKYDTNKDNKLSDAESESVTTMIAETTHGVKGKITSLKGIQFFRNLKELYCSLNNLTELDLSQNQELEVLSCGDNYLSVLDISCCHKLKELQCEFNALTNLDVSHNSKLKYLYCYYNKLDSLDVSNNPELDTIWCYNNNLSSLNLSNNLKLDNVDCSNNQLKVIDLSNNIYLTSFSCFSNYLTSLDVSKNIELELLWCYSNSLTGLDLSENKKLNHIYCWDNLFERLDISSQPNVEYGSIEGESYRISEFLDWGGSIVHDKRNNILIYKKPDSSVVTDVDEEDYSTIPTTVVEGSKATSKDLKFGSDIEFTVPEDVPYIGGGDIKLKLKDMVPVQFEREDNAFRIGIGTTNLNEFSKKDWGDFKKFVDTQKEDCLKGINNYLASYVNGAASLPGKVKPSVKAYGYFEGTIDSSGIHSAGGKAIIEIKAKYDKEWQTWLVSVPIVIKVDASVGVNTTVSIGFDLTESELYIDGALDLSLPKIKLSAGVGITYIADISVYGSVENKVSQTRDKTVAKLVGETGVSAKLLFASYEKIISSGELVYYDSTKPLKLSSLSNAKRNNNSCGEGKWKIDATTPTMWCGNIARLEDNAESEYSEGIMQSDIYGGANPQVVTTDDGKVVLTYIEAVRGRTVNNQYAAVYSVYDEINETWSEPVMIDDDNTADYNINTIVIGNKIYSIWCNMKSQLDDELTVDTYSLRKAASLAEIEIAELDVDSMSVRKYSITNNNALDMQPRICANNGDVYVTWLENTDNDITQEDGTNIIHIGKIKGGKYVESVNKHLTSSIIDYAIGKIENSVYVAHIDSNSKGSINLISFTDGSDYEYNYDGNASNVMFYKVNGKDSLMWNSKGDISSLCSLESVTSLPKAIYSDTDISSKISMFSIDGKDYIIYSSSADKTNKIYARSLYGDGVDGNIELIESRGGIGDVQIFNSCNGYKLVYTRLMMTDDNKNLNMKTDLCEAKVPLDGKLSIDDVEYDEELLTPGEEANVELTVKNDSFVQSTSQDKIEVDCDDKNVGIGYIPTIQPGESKKIRVNVNLPSDLQLNTDMVLKLKRGGILLDSSHESIGKTDLEIETENLGDTIKAYVSNNGKYDSSATLYVYNSDESGQLLYKEDIGDISKNSSIQKEISLDKFVEETDSLELVVKSNHKELYDCNNSSFVYIGDDVLKTLDYIEVSKKVTEYAINSKISVDDLNVYAVYTDGTKKEVYDYTTNVNSISVESEGEKELMISYEQAGLCANASIVISVSGENDAYDSDYEQDYSDSPTSISIKNKKTYKKSNKITIKDEDGIKTIKLNKKKIKGNGRFKVKFKLSKYKKYLKKKGKWNKLIVNDMLGNKKSIKFKTK